METESKWKHRGVRVVHANELDINTAQTPGMNRAAAITNARAETSASQAASMRRTCSAVRTRAMRGKTRRMNCA